MTTPATTRCHDRDDAGDGSDNAGDGSDSSDGSDGSDDQGTAILGLAVVIPARNEEELIGACLTALIAAVDHTRAQLGDACPTLACVVVIDSSDDRTSEIARSFPAVTVIERDSANVGLARAAGVAEASELLGDTSPRSRLWIANTDADSRVPLDWLTVQLDLAAGGADLILGTVRPDFTDLTEEHVAFWLDTHPPGVAHGNAHGANLGLRASLYDRVGRFSPLAEHEDVDLVARLKSHGARTVASAAIEVVTSGRQVGRTPGGYAGYLRAMAEANPSYRRG